MIGSIRVLCGALVVFATQLLFGLEVEAAPVDSNSIKVVVSDSTKIYHGSEKKFKSPAVVDSKRVYEVIPAYKYIQDNNLTEDDPKYWFKMKEATKTFTKALKKLSQKKGHDLVGEIDSMYREDGAEIPDVTDAVITLVGEL